MGNTPIFWIEESQLKHLQEVVPINKGSLALSEVIVIVGHMLLLFD